ncbi:MAG TPA: amino acid adenylation domain-containing protein [Labilithrix sp.]|nr:amino acid adenylation domain-containing protein [Labilithrix sp.]
MLTAAERAQLDAWNATSHRLPDGRPVHELFEAEAARSPDRIAVEIEGARLTYAELDARANDLAHTLQEHGVGRDVLVAVCMERSLELLVAVYAVLKAGGAYAPLDPRLPTARLAFMTRDLEAEVVLSRSGTSLGFDVGTASVIAVDARSAVTRPSKPAASVIDAQLAYVIYTSGSTGTPKAAMNTHGGLGNRLAWMQSEYRLDDHDCVLQKTPFTFDVSVWELFWPLAYGARLVLARPEGHKDPLYLAGLIRSARVTTAHFVPSMLQVFLDEPSASESSPLERVICSGEALPRALVTRFHERFGGELHNLYGPTEASIDVTYWRCARGESGDVPIGRPIWNTQIHVVDESGARCPVGVVGEIWIGGDGVGRGYWKRPDLTAEKFLPDPFAEGSGRRVYRTGDLGRWREDGAVVYLGRLDHQVKIRGFRIELGEIEATIGAQPSVREVVVVAREDAPGEKRLVGYLVGSQGAPVDVEQVRAALRDALPDYMMPSALLVVPSLPLTSSGKVDRQALPAPDFTAAAAAYVAPATATEVVVAGVWAEVLRLARVGRDDDFFALGGDSLLAARVAARLRSSLGVVPPRLFFEAPTLAALAARIDGALAQSGGGAEAPIARVPRGASGARGTPLPVSYMQERLWFLEQFEPGSAAYLMPSAVRLTGPLRADALEQAFAQVLLRHEALRTVFHDQSGTPYQSVSDVAPAWERIDLSALAATERERQVARHVALESTKPFDMKLGPLLRAKLLVLGPEEHVLLSTVHHIASDGWSLGVLARELESLYATLSASLPSTLPELPVQYIDFAVWQRATFGDAAVQGQLAYWKAKLAGAPPALGLPTDRKRPATQRHRGARVTANVEPATTRALEQVARAHGATMYMALLTAFASLLGRLAGEQDVVVATPVVTRARPETEALIGFFMNTLAMRVDLGGSPSFEQLLARVKDTSLDAFANQEVPFDKVVVELNPTRDTSRNPIAQVSLNLLNLPDMRIALPGLGAAPINAATTGSKFDLTLYVAPVEGGGLSLELVYDRDLFEPARMTRILRVFGKVLETFAAHPTTSVDDVSLVLDEDRALLPDPKAPLDAAAVPSFLEQLEAHALRDGSQPCVSDERRHWSYAELRTRSNRLASWLAERAIGPGKVVAIHAERNALAIWALLGVLKSGAAFTLLDAHYPSARLVEQLRIAEPAAWIGAAEATALDGDLAQVVATIEHRIDLASRAAELDALPDAAPALDLPPDRRAYVVFTSGTTGGPKAIAGGLLPLSHFVAWQAKTFELGPADRFSVLSGLAHDPFLRDVLTPLSIGASLHVPPQELRLEPDRLAAWLAEHRITVSHLTPSLGEVLALARGASLRDLRCVFLGGETLRGELVQSLRKLAPKARFVNFYGATETPQAMASFLVDKPLQGPVPIGRGIDGVQLLVLTARGDLAGIDEEGEICVRTPYLALGYLDGTSGGFGLNPFTKHAGDRVYRTGDRGRYLADGNVQSLGRRDDQVKIRGFRVELREIEIALRACDGVRQATAILRDDSRALVGYVVGEVDPGEIIRTLRRRLPDYMVPSAVVRLEAIPLTPNGKVDVRSLPAPQASAAPSGEEGAPANAIEISIAAIWKEVLGTGGLKRRDNFFDVGGHSLNATQVAARLRDTFGVAIPVRTIFEAPTIAELAERVVEAVVKASSPEAMAQALAGRPPGGG